MSDNLLAYIRGLFSFDAVVQRTDPARWDDPPPCERWTARGVVNQQGKKANFIVLDRDPSESIGNTRTIRAMWKNGQKVNDGQLSNAGGTSTGSEQIKGETR
jgi:hypothetical protein